MLEVGEWQIKTQPLYAGIKDGRISPDDETYWSEELNRALETRDVASMRRILGSTRPISARWKFEATNLTTGAFVPVKVGQSRGPGEISTKLMPTDLVPEGSIRMLFPSGREGATLELRATVEMMDTFGTKGQATATIWYLVVAVDNTPASIHKSLLTASQLADVADRDLVGLSQIDRLRQGPTAVDAVHDRARVVRAFAPSAASDNRVSVGELRALVRAAERLRAQ